MKIISDYFKFEDYKNKAKEEFLPKLDEIIKKKHSKTVEKLAKLQSVAKTLNIVLSISSVLTTIAIIVHLTYYKNFTGVLFVAIPGIIAIASTYYLRLKKSKLDQSQMKFQKTS